MSKASDQHAVQMAQARAQLIRAEAEITTLRRALAEEQHATATLTAALDAAQAEAADLRRQLAEANTWAALQAAIAEGFERQLEPIEAERLELRRQLAECQAKLAAIPLAALRRAFYTGYNSDAQVEEDEIAIAAWLEVQP